MSGRITAPELVWVVSCCTKSQYSSIPEISATRFSCSSPQAPRTCGLRSAVTSAAVSRRNASPVSFTSATWLRRSVLIDARSFSTSVSRLLNRSRLS